MQTMPWTFKACHLYVPSRWNSDLSITGPLRSKLQPPLLNMFTSMASSCDERDVRIPYRRWFIDIQYTHPLGTSRIDDGLSISSTHAL